MTEMISNAAAPAAPGEGSAPAVEGAAGAIPNPPAGWTRYAFGGVLAWEHTPTPGTVGYMHYCAECAAWIPGRVPLDLDTFICATCRRPLRPQPFRTL